MPTKPSSPPRAAGCVSSGCAGPGASAPLLLVSATSEALIDALLASLALMPGRPSSLVNLAAARMAQDRHAEAVEDLEQALQSEPDHALAWSRLGEAQLALGQSEAALQAFDRKRLQRRRLRSVP